MVSLGTITFTGISGKNYKFSVYHFGTAFKALGAVYFITHRQNLSDHSYDHTRIYVGQTKGLSERFDNHYKYSCFLTNNANCICIHLDDSEKSRLEKEKDLYDKYHPTCNY